VRYIWSRFSTCFIFLEEIKNGNLEFTDNIGASHVHSLRVEPILNSHVSGTVITQFVFWENLNPSNKCVKQLWTPITIT
jgi:hypothetical protein